MHGGARRRLRGEDFFAARGDAVRNGSVAKQQLRPLAFLATKLIQKSL